MELHKHNTNHKIYYYLDLHISLLWLYKLMIHEKCYSTNTQHSMLSQLFIIFDKLSKWTLFINLLRAINTLNRSSLKPFFRQIKDWLGLIIWIVSVPRYREVVHNDNNICTGWHNWVVTLIGTTTVILRITILSHS